MSIETIPAQKDRMRKLLYERRAAAARRDNGSAGAKLAEQVGNLLSDAVSDAVISAFLPIRTEIGTRSLIERLVADGATVVLPAVVGDNPDLVFRVWAPGDPLVKGAFDVEEPMPDSPSRDPQTLIIPLLAFDRAGYRLGYGGGYYDRAIERLSVGGPVRTIGVAYDGQEVVYVPREAHDQQLDVIVTPTRTIYPES
ncbi:MAG: 5-formyltetrahydrofolate cyclo-ligase [Methyloligellaceae bacterium]